MVYKTDDQLESNSSTKQMMTNLGVQVPLQQSYYNTICHNGRIHAIVNVCYLCL